MGGVYHIYYFHLWREFLLSSCVRRPGLLVVLAMQPLVLVFGIQLAGLFKHPSFCVSVVGWFIRGVVNLTRAVKYAVQTRRSRIVSFEWLFPLTGPGAAESGIKCRIFRIVAIVRMLMSIASWLSVTVADI